MSFFHMNFYKENLRRLKSRATVMFVILLIQAVLVPIGVYVNNGTQGASAQEFQFLAVLILMLPLFAFSMMSSLFNDLNTRNGSDFFLALPVSRSAMITTGLCAVLTVTAVLFIIPSAVQIILLAIIGYKFTVSSILQTFVFVMVVSFYLSGARILAKSFTGTKFSENVVCMMILLYPRLFIFFVAQIITFIAPYLVLNNSGNILFDYHYNLLVHFISVGEATLSSSIYTTILGCVYFGLAYYFFNKRPGETATYPSTSQLVQGIIRTLISLMFCLIPIACIFSTDNLDADTIFLIVVLFIIALIIYFVYDILANKKISCVKIAAKKIWLLVVLNILTIAFILGVTENAKSKTVAADDIDYITVSNYCFVSYYTYYRGNQFLRMVLEKEILRGEDLFKEVSKELSYAIEEGDEYKRSSYQNKFSSTVVSSDEPYIVEIHKKNGKTLTRKLYINKSAFSNVTITEEMRKQLEAPINNIDQYTEYMMYSYQYKDDKIETVDMRTGYLNNTSQIFNTWNSKLSVEQKWRALTGPIANMDGEVHGFIRFSCEKMGMRLYIDENDIPKELMDAVILDQNNRINSGYETDMEYDKYERYDDFERVE